MVGTKPIEIDGSYNFHIVRVDSTVGWIDGRHDMKCSTFADVVDIIIACGNDNDDICLMGGLKNMWRKSSRCCFVYERR